jgi:hypothetical protein
MARRKLLLVLLALSLSMAGILAQEERWDPRELFQPEVTTRMSDGEDYYISKSRRRYRPKGHIDNGFSFCRLVFYGKGRTIRKESGKFGTGGNNSGWSTDYPRSDVYFSLRLSELTLVHVNSDKDGRPEHWTVDANSREIFTCPFIFASDVGTMELGRPGLNGETFDNLREYLLKGGFLWVDDFWGDIAWANWEEQIGKVLSPEDYPIVDLPENDPIFSIFFRIAEVPQIVDLKTWEGNLPLES